MQYDEKQEAFDEAAKWLFGLGILILALAPLAIPILVLTLVFTLPLLIPVIAIALVVGVLVAVGAGGRRAFRAIRAMSFGRRGGLSAHEERTRSARGRGAAHQAG